MNYSAEKEIYLKQVKKSLYASKTKNLYQVELLGSVIDRSDEISSKLQNVRIRKNIRETFYFFIRFFKIFLQTSSSNTRNFQGKYSFAILIKKQLQKWEKNK